MRSLVKAIVIAILVLLSIGVGYWLGTSQPLTTRVVSTEPPQSDNKILYYRNPMGLPDISPVPKKDPMGMDYIPVYEGEELPDDSNAVKISTEKIQKLGVRTEKAMHREMVQTIRAVATIQPDERKLYALVTKFEGWIHRLFVNTTGQAVKKGEALMEVYSPVLITAQHEYLIARKGSQLLPEGGQEAGAKMRRLVDSTLQRLRNLDISEIELQRLQHEGEIRQYVTLRSKAHGEVLDKPSIEGMRFEPGEILYQIADLSSVWVLVDVFEQDLAMIHPGQRATIRVDAYPDKVFSGQVDFIYPKITPETRTAIVRIELPNPDRLLKPDMYARVEFTSLYSKNKVLAVPDSAVLDTGTRQLVLVDLGEGRYGPRTVKLGMYADGYAEVKGGLDEGESVVVKANFLIDAESNLKAALNNFGHDDLSPASNVQSRAQSGSVIEGMPAATHQGVGIIEAIDFAHATVTLSHEPIASLNWPSMIMDFRVDDLALLRTMKPGQQIEFQIVEKSAGEYVIVAAHPVAASTLGKEN